MLKNNLIVGLVFLFCCQSSFTQENKLPQVAEALSTKIQHYKSVFQVFTIRAERNYHSPWIQNDFNQVSGSAFLLNYQGQSFIITNAHVIENAHLVRLRKVNNDQQVTAQVKAISYSRDLALLELSDSSFLEGIDALDLVQQVDIGETVYSYGFDIGGSKINMTKGVLSRKDFVSYVVSGYKNLTYQIDAAINPGKSGGPALYGNQVIGVNFQGIQGDADNVGYIIPSSVIVDFLDEFIENQQSAEIPAIGIQFSPLQNQQLRRINQLESNETGILITALSQAETNKNLFQLGDVILSINGHAIGNEGNIAFSDDNIHWQSIITNKHIGDSVKVTIKRQGKTDQIDYPLTHTHTDHYVVPGFTTKLDYIVIGGLVIVELDRALAKKLFYENFEHYRLIQNHQSKRLLLITNVLSHPINEYYESYRYHIVSKLNGQAIPNLAQLKQSLAENQESLVQLQIRDAFYNNYTLGFSKNELDVANKEINTLYHIPE